MLMHINQKLFINMHCWCIVGAAFFIYVLQKMYKAFIHIFIFT